MNSRTVFIVLFMAGCFTLNAQRTIIGTVRSMADWTPIPNVTVLIKGTVIGTLTDQNGNYSITYLMTRHSHLPLCRASYAGNSHRLQFSIEYSS